jgi:hypothetical protein
MGIEPVRQWEPSRRPRLLRLCGPQRADGLGYQGGYAVNSVSNEFDNIRGIRSGLGSPFDVSPRV